MRFWLLTMLVLVSFPLSASAASFAKQSLFLSKTPVTEGETVLIHAVVANDSNVKFDGEVVFKDNTKTTATGGVPPKAVIGSVAVSIAAGGANAVSLSWKPVAGSHSVLAELTASDGSVVESESATFVIDSKPQPLANTSISSSTSDTVDSSSDIQKKISDLSPTAGSIVAPIFSALDSARTTAANALDTGIDWAKQKTGGKSPGEVLGAATSTSSGGIIDTIWLVLATIALYILTLLRFVVGNAGIFYPVFAILFFYFLWKTFKRFRRPSYPTY